MKVPTFLKNAERITSKSAGLGLIKAQTIILENVLRNCKRKTTNLRQSFLLEQLSHSWMENRDRMIKNPEHTEEKKAIAEKDIQAILELCNQLIETIVDIKGNSLNAEKKEIRINGIIGFLKYFTELKARYGKGNAEISVESIKENLSEEDLKKVKDLLIK